MIAGKSKQLRDELNRQRQLQELIIDVFGSFVSVPLEAVDSAINASLAKVAKFVDADRVNVTLYNFDKQECRSIHEWCGEGIEPFIDALRSIPMGDRSEALHHHCQGQSFIIPDVAALPPGAFRESLSEQQIKSLVSVPMMRGGYCKGFVGFDAVKEKRLYTDSELRLLSGFAQALLSLQQRQESEEALQSSDGKWKSYVENAPYGIAIVDRGGRYLDVNPAMCASTGYTQGELLTMSISDLVTEHDSIGSGLEHFSKVNQDGYASGEVPFHTKHGDERWWTIVAQKIAENRFIGFSDDTTERKQVEAALQASEEKYRSTFEYSPIGVCHFDSQGIIVDCNGNFAEIIGASREVLVGVDVFVLADKQIVDCIKGALQGVLTSYEGYYHSETATKVTFLKAKFSPIFSKTNEIIGAIAIVEDITECKQAEDELHDSEAKFRAISESALDAVIMTNHKGQLTYWSPSAERIFGYTRSEAMGANIHALLLPDKYQARFDKGWDALKHTGLGTAVGRLHEMIVNHKSGREIHIEMALSPVLIQGRYWSSAIIRDSTERKKMERLLYTEKEQFKTTLLSVGDGVISTDDQGNVVLMNRVAEQLTGWKQGDASGRGLAEVFKTVNELTRATCGNPVYEVLTTGHSKEIANNSILISYDGTEWPIEDTAAPIRDENNNISGVVLVFRDVTEQRERLSKVEYLSFHDQLTGLYNRRFFDEEIIRLSVKPQLPLTLAILDVNGLKLINDAFGHFAGDRVLQKIAEVMKRECRAEDIIARIGGDEFVILLPKTTALQAATIVKRIVQAAAAEKVESVNISVSYGLGAKTNSAEPTSNVFKRSEDDLYRYKLSESASIRHMTIRIIMNTLHEKSNREQQHSHRVSELCVAIATALGLSNQSINELRTAGLMHDIGKIAIEDGILNKTIPLNEAEWLVIKRHPEIGYRILSSVNAYASLAEYVLAHQERWDGKGYPKGLKGEEIPFEARIIAVADAYDAMTSDRAYRKAMSSMAAMEEIRNNAGVQFDPHIAQVFVEKVLLLSHGAKVQTYVAAGLGPVADMPD